MFFPLQFSNCWVDFLIKDQRSHFEEDCLVSWCWVIPIWWSPWLIPRGYWTHHALLQCRDPFLPNQYNSIYLGKYANDWVAFFWPFKSTISIPKSWSPKNAQLTQTIATLPNHCMARQRSCSHHLARRGSCYRRVTGSGTARFRSGRILSGNVAWTSRLGWRFLGETVEVGMFFLGLVGE